ncbi:MAG: hypothetical protein KDG58_17815, partial [Anaerolineae bacterium]|nr:hypothetical protein [Anaerolineae bacterium]
MEFSHVFSFQLRPDLFKSSYRFLRVETLTAVQANLSLNFYRWRMNTTAQQLPASRGNGHIFADRV